MRISAKAEYACLAVIELARPGGNGTPRRIRDIAEAQGIPEHYLVQILIQLKTAGIVQSARGAEGGYHLVRRPEDLSVADIVGAIDGPGDTTLRAKSPEAAELGAIFRRALAAEREVLSSASIAQFRNSAPAHDWVL